AAAVVPVAAAARGRISYAGLAVGGWGNLVIVAHAKGIETLYAHLSRVDVHLGQEVAAGARIGLVGAAGPANGAHATHRRQRPVAVYEMVEVRGRKPPLGGKAPVRDPSLVHEPHDGRAERLL